MDQDPKVLQICHICRLVHDERETMDRWVSKKTYRLATGIDPITCRLTHTYCPVCYAYVMRKMQAA
jgi:uncharacterized protein (UPF0212 family)